MSGLGDLVMTATDSLSRNHALGVRMGKDTSLETCLKGQQTVTERITTSISIHQLGTQNQLEMPICEVVYKVLHAQLSCKDALSQLLEREPPEAESTKFRPNQPGANG